MLRKSLVAVLILLYSATAIGVPLHIHYCRGELKHVSFLLKLECHVPGADASEHTCCQEAKPLCGSGHTLNSCCDDATQWVQDNLPAICSKSDLDALSLSSTVVLEISAPIVLTEQNLIPATDIFLRQADNPLYLLQCAFIFYG